MASPFSEVFMENLRWKERTRILGKADASILIATRSKIPGSGHESSTRKADFPRWVGGGGKRERGRSTFVVNDICVVTLRAPLVIRSIELSLATRGGDYFFFFLFFSPPRNAMKYSRIYGEKMLARTSNEIDIEQTNDSTIFEIKKRTKRIRFSEINNCFSM